MAKLLLLKGLPASGKSTHAFELVKKGWKRVNKDDLRALIDNSQYSKKNEMFIKYAEIDIATRYLREGFEVVVDDTNFGYEEMWERIAKDNGAEFEVKFFDTPFAECVERDTKRGSKSVGAKVIQRMYDQYLKPTPPEWSEDKQNCYIFDIDGTLALKGDRGQYDYSKVNTDTPNHNITMIARLLAQSGLPIIIVSGRTDDCMVETMAWLKNNSVPFSAIHMRRSGDDRKDSIVKKEIFDNILKDKYNILAVFDDRNQVVDMWRSLGITCLQVAYGNF